MRYCKFRIMSNGRITCVAHHQTLMYIFENGNILCQVREDELITKMGFDNYLKWVNEKHIKWVKGKRSHPPQVETQAKRGVA